MQKIPSSTIGLQTVTKGLGINGQGMTNHIQVMRKTRYVGLGYYKVHFPKWNKENGKKRLLFKNMDMKFCTHCHMSGHSIDKFWELHSQLHWRKNPKYVKIPIKRHVAASVEVDSLPEKFESEFSLMDCLGNIVYEDIEAWFVDNGSSCHMTRMRLVFFSFTKIDSDYYVGSETNVWHAMKGVRYVRLSLELDGYLEMVETLFIPELKVNFLLVSTLEEEVYVDAF
jgi:hypothetical protein